MNVEHRFGKTYSVSGTGFLNRIDDLIELRIDPLDGRRIYENSTPVQIRGVAFELEAKWPGGLDGKISYSLQDSRNVVTDDVLAQFC